VVCSTGRQRMVIFEKDLPLCTHEDKKMTVPSIRNKNFLKALA